MCLIVLSMHTYTHTHTHTHTPGNVEAVPAGTMPTCRGSFFFVGQMSGNVPGRICRVSLRKDILEREKAHVLGHAGHKGGNGGGKRESLQKPSSV